MKIHQLPINEALASVRSTPQGLASADATARLLEYGANRVEPLAREHWALRLLKEFTHLFSVILWVAAALAFLADWYDPGQGMARVGVAVIVVILLSGLFSFWQEARVERTLAALQGLLPSQIELLRDGAVLTVAAEALVPGDVILLAQGDNVPADCRLIEAFGLRINRATVTGESLPRSCDAAPCSEEQAFDARNILLAGTSVVAGQGRAVVFATGAHTEFGRIAHLTQSGGSEDSPLRREIAHLSRRIAYLALGIGTFFFVLGSVVGVPFWRDLILTLGIIVALVPEGLLPTLTLSLVLAAQRMAHRNVLIRHLPSVETLGSVTVICTDKTGTLTENRISVLPLCESIVLAGGVQPLDAETRSTILRAQEEMAAGGLRVIALASRHLPPDCPRDAEEQALSFCGLAGIEDPPRADVEAAIATCHGAGIQVIMVTGDHPGTAIAIARQIGLVRGKEVQVITGDQLRKLAPAQLQLALDASEILFARVAADQKMRIVDALKAKGHIVAVTGDGVNDAPALRTAHIGIAMGITGTDVAKEAAEMVLLDDHFASIVSAIEEGRAVFQNIRKFLTYVLVHNVAELMVLIWPPTISCTGRRPPPACRRSSCCRSSMYSCAAARCARSALPALPATA